MMRQELTASCYRSEMTGSTRRGRSCMRLLDRVDQTWRELGRATSDILVGCDCWFEGKKIRKNMQIHKSIDKCPLKWNPRS